MIVMDKRTVLIADDEKIILRVLSEEFQEAGFQVDIANHGQEAIDFLCKKSYDVVILDHKMPKKNGLEVLGFIEAKELEPIVVLMTAYGTINHAVEAMKKGAYDYITKPFDSEELLEKVQSALSEKSEKQDFWQNKTMIPNPFLGKSKAFLSIKETIEKVKNIQSTILITGESGTGKGVVAREIHRKGYRAKEPFIHINCAALPENLIESELFGHMKGSFTGAYNDKKGKLQLAGEGTVFLDEISLLDHTLQAKLLTVLQERKIEPIGGTKPIDLKARIIAASNANLEYEMHQGRFRKDLFYRINVISIHCTALRYRKEDIELLTSHFLTKYNKLHGKSVKGLSKHSIDTLMAYHWPGNVRELENYIERAVAMSKGDVIEHIDINHLSLDSSHNGQRPVYDNKTNTGGLSLEEQEYQAILEALSKNDGHREKTAEALGISRRTLQYKLKRYGLN